MSEDHFSSEAPGKQGTADSIPSELLKSSQQPAQQVPWLVWFSSKFFSFIFNPFMLGVFYGAGYLLGSTVFKWFKAKVKAHL